MVFKCQLMSISVVACSCGVRVHYCYLQLLKCTQSSIYEVLMRYLQASQTELFGTENQTQIFYSYRLAMAGFALLFPDNKTAEIFFTKWLRK